MERNMAYPVVLMCMDYILCESRVQMQVGSGDTAHGSLPWRVSSLATHAEPKPLNAHKIFIAAALHNIYRVYIHKAFKVRRTAIFHLLYLYYGALPSALQTITSLQYCIRLLRTSQWTLNSGYYY